MGQMAYFAAFAEFERAFFAYVLIVPSAMLSIFKTAINSTIFEYVNRFIRKKYANDFYRRILLMCCCIRKLISYANFLSHSKKISGFFGLILNLVVQHVSV